MPDKKNSTFLTKPTPCTKERGFAHHYSNIHQTHEGDPYAQDTCLYCVKPRLFKVAWPQKLDWNALKAARGEEERKRFRKRGGKVA